MTGDDDAAFPDLAPFSVLPDLPIRFCLVLPLTFFPLFFRGIEPIVLVAVFVVAVVGTNTFSSSTVSSCRSRTFLVLSCLEGLFILVVVARDSGAAIVEDDGD